MRYVSILLVLLLISSGIKAQAFTVGSPTPLFNIRNASFSSYSVGPVRNFILSDADVAANSRTHMFAVMASGTMHDEDVELPDEGKERGFLNSVMGTKEKMFVFRSVFSKSQKRNVLSAHPVTMQIQVDPQGIEAAAIPASKANKCGDFGINVSASGERVVVYSQYPAEKEANEKFALSVFDASMKKLWFREYTYPVPAIKDPFNDVFVSDKGTACIVKRTDLENFSVYLLRDDKSELKETKLNLGAGKKIMNYSVAFTESGDAVISGFYTASSDLKLNASFDGCFVFIADEGKMKSFAVNPFETALYDLDIRYVLPQPDGRILLAAEEFVREETGMGEGREGGEQMRYKSGSVHLFMLDQDGEKVWNTSIAKKGQSENDGGLFQRFGLYCMNDKFYVFFNDENSRYSSQKGKVPFVVAVKKDGSKENPVSLLNRRIGGDAGEIFLLPSVGLSQKNSIMFMGVSEESFFPLSISF